MNGNRLLSVLASLCLHLAVLALALWWPAPAPRLPDLSEGVLVSGLVTLGAPGKTVPGSRNEVPKGTQGPSERTDGAADVRDTAKERETPPPPDTSRTTPPPRVEETVKPPVEIEPGSTLIPEDPTKKTEPVKEEPKTEDKPKPEEKPKAEDKPKVEEKPKPEEKPKADDKPKDKEKPKDKPEEKPKDKPKPEEKPKDKPKPKKEDDLAAALADLDKEVRKGRTGARDPGPDAGQDLSRALADLGKSVGGDGNDASGAGPGGSGGGAVGALGAYEQVIASTIKENWHAAETAQRNNLKAWFIIRIGADGVIQEYRLIQSSGNQVYDLNVQRAIAYTRQLDPPPFGKPLEVRLGFSFY